MVELDVVIIVELWLVLVLVPVVGELRIGLGVMLLRVVEYGPPPKEHKTVGSLDNLWRCEKCLAAG